MSPELFTKLLALPHGDLAKMYVEFRNERDAANKRKKAFQARMDALAIVVQQALLDAKTDGFRAIGHTVFKYDLVTARCSDPEEFMNFVIENQAFDLLERRASQAACEVYAAENDGEPPPGVIIDVLPKIGVRKISSRAKKG